MRFFLLVMSFFFHGSLIFAQNNPNCQNWNEVVYALGTDALGCALQNNYEIVDCTSDYNGAYGKIRLPVDIYLGASTNAFDEAYANNLIFNTNISLLTLGVPIKLYLNEVYEANELDPNTQGQTSVACLALDGCQCPPENDIFEFINGNSSIVSENTITIYYVDDVIGVVPNSGTCSTISAGGFASFPDVGNFIALEYVNPNSTNRDFLHSVDLIHELGHFFGLEHTFGNSANDPCGFGLDQISDTADNGEGMTCNIMDYNKEALTDFSLVSCPLGPELTLCQKAKMSDLLFHCRNNLGLGLQMPDVVYFDSEQPVSTLAAVYGEMLPTLYVNLNGSHYSNDDGFAHWTFNHSDGSSFELWADTLDLNSIYGQNLINRVGDYLIEVRDRRIYNKNIESDPYSFTLSLVPCSPCEPECGIVTNLNATIGSCNPTNNTSPVTVFFTGSPGVTYEVEIVGQNGIQREEVTVATTTTSTSVTVNGVIAPDTYLVRVRDLADATCNWETITRQGQSCEPAGCATLDNLRAENGPCQPDNTFPVTVSFDGDAGVDYSISVNWSGAGTSANLTGGGSIVINNIPTAGEYSVTVINLDDPDCAPYTVYGTGLNCAGDVCTPPELRFVRAGCDASGGFAFTLELVGNSPANYIVEDNLGEYTSFNNQAPGPYTFTYNPPTGQEVVITATDKGDASCFTTYSIDLPASCASCWDGIQNGDETAIDCGGSLCADCLGGAYTISTNIPVNSCVEPGTSALISWSTGIGTPKPDRISICRLRDAPNFPSCTQIAVNPGFSGSMSYTIPEGLQEGTYFFQIGEGDPGPQTNSTRFRVADDCSVAECPLYLVARTPLNLQTVPQGQVTFAWDIAASTYGMCGNASAVVSYGLDLTLSNPTQIPTTDTFAIASITPGTYYWQVEVCNTAGACITSDPRVLIVDDGTTTCYQPFDLSARRWDYLRGSFSWQVPPEATGRTFQYRQVGATGWISVSGGSQNFQTASVEPGQSYEWRVRTICGGSGEASSWSVGDIYLAPTDCDRPRVYTDGNLYSITGNLTMTTFRAFWDAVPSTSGYILRYREAGLTDWNEITITDSASESYQITGLTPGTDYEWQLVSSCTDGTELSSITQPFTTFSCEPPNNLRIESLTHNGGIFKWDSDQPEGTLFQYSIRPTGTLPSGVVGTVFEKEERVTGLIPNTTYDWNVFSVCSGYSATYTFTTEDGSNVCRDISFSTAALTNNQDGTLTLNGTLENTGNDIIYVAQGTGQSGLVVQVQGSLDDQPDNGDEFFIQGGWNPGNPYDPNTPNFLFPGESLNFSTSFPMPSPAVQYLKGFTQFLGGSADCNPLNDTQFLDLPNECEAPTNLRQYFFRESFAGLIWNAAAGVGSYNLDYRITGTSNWTTLSVNDVRRVISGLTPATNYEARIQSVCPSGGGSEWSPIVSFYTYELCVEPTNLSVVSVSSNEVTLGWDYPNSNLDYFELEYKEQDATNWTLISDITNSQVVIDGLSPLTNYEWRVKTVCTTNSESIVSFTNVFTTTAFTLPPGDDGCSWGIIDAGLTGNINAISFPSDQVGYIAQFNPTGLYKTVDGGNVWTHIPGSDAFGIVFDLEFVSQTEGWATTSNGNYRYTSDGGNSWSTHQSGSSNEKFSIDVVDGDHAFAVGALSGFALFEKTTDGINWDASFLPGGNANTLDFYDANLGLIGRSNGNVSRTTDGGATWTEIATGLGNVRFVRFLDQNTVFASGSEARIAKSFDGGLSWTFIDVIPGTSLGGGLVKDEQKIYLVDDNSRAILVTTDGGQSWGAVYSPPNQGAFAFNFGAKPNGDVYVGGLSGTLVAGDCGSVIISCNDGVQNGDETGIDCGGPDCAPCPTCFDGVQNGDETGVDCGGADCAPCISPVQDVAITIADVNGTEGQEIEVTFVADSLEDLVSFQFAVDYPAENLAFVSATGQVNGSEVLTNNPQPGEIRALNAFGLNGFTAQDVNLLTVRFLVLRECPSEISLSTAFIQTEFLQLGNNFLPVDDSDSGLINEGIACCYDGVQNGGETGIDCGGPDCAPCALPCDAITVMDVTRITYDSAMVFWNNGVDDGSSYEVRFRVFNTPEWTTLSNVDDAFAVITGLTGSFTLYEWQVRRQCGGSFSDWSSSRQFRTPYASAGYVAEACDWNLIPTPGFEDLKDISWFGDTAYVLRSTSRYYLKTTDGGASWTVDSIPNVNYLTALTFFDENIGYAHATVIPGINTFYKTIDGGNNWVAQSAPSSQQIREISCVTADVVFAVGRGATFMRTYDGGNTWELKSTPLSGEFYSVDFWDASRGIASGESGQTLITEDGGDSWTSSPTGLPYYVYNHFILNDSTVYAAGDRGVGKSTDGGYSWTLLQPGRSNFSGAGSVAFVNEQIGYATTDSEIRYTADGGQSWTDLNDNVRFRMPADEVVFTRSGQLVAVGINGMMLLQDICSTCTDGIQNGHETGVDCGGPDCAPCSEPTGLTVLDTVVDVNEPARVEVRIPAGTTATLMTENGAVSITDPFTSLTLESDVAGVLYPKLVVDGVTVDGGYIQVLSCDWDVSVSQDGVTGPIEDCAAIKGGIGYVHPLDILASGPEAYANFTRVEEYGLPLEELAFEFRFADPSSEDAYYETGEAALKLFGQLGWIRVTFTENNGQVLGTLDQSDGTTQTLNNAIATLEDMTDYSLWIDNGVLNVQTGGEIFSPGTITAELGNFLGVEISFRGSGSVDRLAFVHSPAQELFDYEFDECACEPVAEVAVPTIQEISERSLHIALPTPLASGVRAQNDLIVAGEFNGRYPGNLQRRGSQLVFRSDRPFSAGEELNVTLAAGLTLADGSTTEKYTWKTTVPTRHRTEGQFFLAPLGIVLPADALNNSYTFSAADFDRNGTMDIIFHYFVSYGAPSNQLVYLRNPDGTFQPPTAYSNARSHSGLRGTPDLNGDGYPDMLVSHNVPSSVMVRLNNGDGTFGAEQYYTVGSFSNGLTYGDIDADGDIDVISASGLSSLSGNTFTVLYNNGSGVFTAQSTNTGIFNATRHLADLDNDGDLDLAYTSSTSFGSQPRFRIYENDGNGQLSLAVDQPNPGPQYISQIVDLNGDGNLDLLLSTPTDIVVFGDGTLNYDYANQLSLSSDRFATVAIDADGDQDQDLLRTRRYDGAAWVGPLQVGRQTAPGIFTPWTGTDEVLRNALYPIDFDGDGDVDHLTVDATRKLHLLENIDAAFYIDLYVGLTGPYNTVDGMMSDALRTGGHLPEVEPYNVDCQRVMPGVLAVTGSAAITDWLVLELRNAAGEVIRRRSALLCREGRVVDMDGVSPVKFDVIPEGDYSLVVRHRNHLAIQSRSTMPVGIGDTVLVDFMDPTVTPTVNDTDQYDPGDGTRVMISGDANGDGQVNAVDRNNFWRLQNGTGFRYRGSDGDFNLDGAVNAVDVNAHWRIHNSKVTAVQDD